MVATVRDQSRRLPRARGDEPLLDKVMERRCPARAGMNPFACQRAQPDAALPRARGDEPRCGTRRAAAGPYTPARAGMNPGTSE